MVAYESYMLSWKTLFVPNFKKGSGQQNNVILLFYFYSLILTLIFFLNYSNSERFLRYSDWIKIFIKRLKIKKLVINYFLKVTLLITITNYNNCHENFLFSSSGILWNVLSFWWIFSRLPHIVIEKLLCFLVLSHHYRFQKN